MRNVYVEREATYEEQFYDCCPICGGDYETGSDHPQPGDESQGCVGFREDRTEAFNAACANANGCGWFNIYEKHKDHPGF